jgi:hypothetical protein
MGRVMIRMGRGVVRGMSMCRRRVRIFSRCRFDWGPWGAFDSVMSGVFLPRKGRLGFGWVYEI